MQQYADNYLRTELLDGKLVNLALPNANHNFVSLNIASIIRNYLKGKKCTVFNDNMCLQLTEKDKVIPDIMVVCDRDKIKMNSVVGTPELVVEILSRSTMKRDKTYKKDLYERCGVGEYWIVDMNNRSIEVYLLSEGKYTLDEVYTLANDDDMELMTDQEKAGIKSELSPALFPDLKLSLVEIFEDLL